MPYNLDTLAAQFKGRKFGELVLAHCRSCDTATGLAALHGTIGNLPQDVLPLVEPWVITLLPCGESVRFWEQDCGATLSDLSRLATAEFKANDISLSNHDVLNMVQVLVLSFAGAARTDPKFKAFIQKAVGMGFFRRMLF